MEKLSISISFSVFLSHSLTLSLSAPGFMFPSSTYFHSRISLHSLSVLPRFPFKFLICPFLNSSFIPSPFSPFFPCTLAFPSIAHFTFCLPFVSLHTLVRPIITPYNHSTFPPVPLSHYSLFINPSLVLFSPTTSLLTFPTSLSLSSYCIPSNHILLCSRTIFFISFFLSLRCIFSLFSLPSDLLPRPSLATFSLSLPLPS